MSKRYGAGDKLDGNDWSWLDYDCRLPGEDFSFVYVTNCGIVKMSQSGYVLDAIYGIGRNYPNTSLEVQLDCNRYRVSTSRMTIEDEVFNHPDMSRSHAGRKLHLLPIQKVIDVIENDNNMSIAGIAVKRQLLQILIKDKRTTRQQVRQINRIFRKYRKRIHLVQRVSIITKRVPILNM